MTLPDPAATGPASAEARPVTTAMINRTVELGEILSELQRIAAGETAGAVLVLGACGIGKTRLVTEVIAQAGQFDVQVMHGQCVGRGAEPLLPIRDALASYLGPTPERIKQFIKEVAPKLLDLVPFIGRFLVPVAEAIVAGPQLGGSSVQGVYAGLERLFRGLAERRGLCLVVEDIHEADQDTLYFLTYLLQKAAETRILAIVSLDEDELDSAQLAEIVDGWLVQGWKRVALRGLPKAEIAQFVTTPHGQQPDQAFVDDLWELTAGNMLLLQELLPVIQSGAASQLGADITTLTLPQRVQALLNRRLLRLDRETRTFLEVAATCLEDTHEFGAVAPTLKIDEDHALTLLDECSRLGLMTETSPGGVQFVHEAMRLAVYGKIPEATRRRFHGRAAEWYEANGHAPAAAHHYARAGRTDDLVRAAMSAAALAEHAGMYHSAAAFYRQARPYSPLQTIGVPLGRCLIVLGEWDQAETLLQSLPQDSAAVRLLWSDLHFVRGKIRTAAADVEDILPSAEDARLDCLLRLADIYLYLGEFETATRHANDALATAQQSESPIDRIRGLAIVAATQFFGGDIDNAERAFREAYDMLDAIPEQLRDRTRYTVLLGNLGQVAEARGNWSVADEFHRRALTIRREVFDARGLLQSIHARARARIGMGDLTEAGGYLDEADQLAARLGEPLEQAKIALTRAKLAFAQHDPARSVALGEHALRGFTECGTSFDVAHARLALAQMRTAADERGALADGAAARTTVERLGFGLLRHEFPTLAFSYRDRILAALNAYACGDAFGLPAEGSPPAGINVAAAAALPARPGWARGATSDDTALTLLAAEALTTSAGEDPAARFMRLLGERADNIQGLGPSTFAAVQHYRQHGEGPSEGGETNGAVMRALPVGWFVPLDDPDRRRTLTVDMSRVTHPSPNAQCAAVVMSACAAWALEGSSARQLLTVAREEASVAATMCGADRRIEALLAAVDADRWSAGAAGVSLDPYETVAAVLYCVVTARSLAGGIEAGLRLGGDTDTVAALVGGLLGSQSTADGVRTALPWYGDVLLPAPGQVSALADGIAIARVADVRG
jgi:ADP-ribosyl-[dinitrogen reductase] hydrolase